MNKFGAFMERPRKLEFILDIGLDAFWNQAQIFLENGQWRYWHEQEVYFLEVRQRIISPAQRCISLDGVRPVRGFFKRRKKQPAVIKFELNAISNEKIRVKAQLNLREAQLELLFLQLLLWYVTPFPNSEAARVIAAEYPPDPLDEDMHRIAIAVVSLDEFLALIRRFAVLYARDNQDVEAVAVREADRSWYTYGRIEKRLLSLEPLRLDVYISYWRDKTHPTLKYTQSVEVSDRVRFYLLPLSNQLEIWSDDPQMRSGEHNEQFLQAFLTYLWELRVLPSNQAFPPPVYDGMEDLETENPKSGVRSGRKGHLENDWALIETKVRQRAEVQAYRDWLEFRKRLKRPPVNDAWESFQKAIAAERKLRDGYPENGWAWIKRHLQGQSEDAVYQEWRGICLRLDREPHLCARDVFEEKTKK